MGINRALTAASHDVTWNGEQATTVRGLTPQDFSAILVAEGLTIAEFFTNSERVNLRGINLQDTDQVASALQSQGGPLLMSLASHAPSVLARIIAVASDEEDIEEATAHVAVNFSAPLQFECLAQIARMTFNGPEGFRLFVGNVMTLVQSVRAMTSTSGAPRSLEARSSASGSAPH